MKEGPRRALAQALGVDVAATSRVTGGDICEAWRVELADGRVVFAKTRAQAPPAMFPAEARGLAWLGEAQAIGLPEVLGVSPEVLVLQWVEPGPRCADFSERLGRQLAALHRHQPAAFGLDHDNFIGTLSQPNRAAPTWAAFYRDQRLAPRVAGCAAQGLLPPDLRRRLARLLDHLESFLGPPEPPARLHGDLWGGNLHTTPTGRPCLVDPAVHGGHRELDLAMMRLFGGFDDACFAAYEEAWPLSPGEAERRPLHQLYYLLVHLELFGPSYLGAVESAVAPFT